MKLSARNQIPARVTAIHAAPVAGRAAAAA